MSEEKKEKGSLKVEETLTKFGSDKINKSLTAFKGEPTSIAETPRPKPIKPSK